MQGGDPVIPLPLWERLGEGCRVEDEKSVTDQTQEMRARARQLRQTITPMQAALWAKLKARACGGFKFRRQAPVGPYVVGLRLLRGKGDCRTSMEPRMKRQRGCDASRTRWFETQGYQVMRFMQTRMCVTILKGVWESIKAPCEDRRGPLS